MIARHNSTAGYWRRDPGTATDVECDTSSGLVYVVVLPIDAPRNSKYARRVWGESGTQQPPPRVVETTATATRKAAAIRAAVASGADETKEGGADKRETRAEVESMKHTTRLLIAEVVLLLLSLAVAAVASS